MDLHPLNTRGPPFGNATRRSQVTRDLHQVPATGSSEAAPQWVNLPPLLKWLYRPTLPIRKLLAPVAVVVTLPIVHCRVCSIARTCMMVLKVPFHATVDETVSVP